MDKIGKLYHNYQILSDSAVKASEHEAEYLEIIQAAKGDNNEKNLACQFIPSFLKKFPYLAKTALDAELDLMKDEDVSIRKLAIKYSPMFCNYSKFFLKKVSDVLAQLLGSEDNSEIIAVQGAFNVILKSDVISAFDAILLQITSTDNQDVRNKALDFLATEFIQLSDDIITSNVEEHILTACRSACRVLSKQDFPNLLPVLLNLKITRTIPVQRIIVTTVADHIDFDAEFNISADNINDFMNCVKKAERFFSPFVTSLDYVYYICMKILPKMDEVIALENGSELFLGILKLLAEISQCVTENEKTKECTEVVYNHVLKYIPLPPKNDDKHDSVFAANDWQFTSIECFLFTFALLLKYNSDFITGEDNSSRFKDLKLRLLFLGRSVQQTLKSLRKPAKISELDVKIEEAQKEVTFRTLNNISVLIKVFFKSPPTFKSTITLSWKPPIISFRKFSVKRESGSPSSDRKPLKREKHAGRELYIPPTGKYSSRVNLSYDKAKTLRKNNKRFH